MKDMAREELKELQDRISDEFDWILTIQEYDVRLLKFMQGLSNPRLGLALLRKQNLTKFNKIIESLQYSDIMEYIEIH